MSPNQSISLQVKCVHAKIAWSITSLVTPSWYGQAVKHKRNMKLKQHSTSSLLTPSSLCLFSGALVKNVTLPAQIPVMHCLKSDRLCNAGN